MGESSPEAPSIVRWTVRVVYRVALFVEERTLPPLPSQLTQVSLPSQLTLRSLRVASVPTRAPTPPPAFAGDAWSLEAAAVRRAARVGWGGFGILWRTSVNPLSLRTV